MILPSLLVLYPFPKEAAAPAKQQHHAVSPIVLTVQQLILDSTSLQVNISRSGQGRKTALQVYGLPARESIIRASVWRVRMWEQHIEAHNAI
jgi:hypothetical protein